MRRYYKLWLYAVTLIAFASSAIQSMFEEKRLLNETEARASSLATSIEDSISSNYHATHRATHRAKRANNTHMDRIARTVERLRNRRQILGLTLCPSNARAIAFPRGSGWEPLCDSASAKKAIQNSKDLSWIATASNAKFHYYAHPIDQNLLLILIQDLSYLRMHWITSFTRVFLPFWAAGILLVLFIAFQVHHWLRPVTDLAEKVLTFKNPKKDPVWLHSLRRKMGNKSLTIIANREPYIHEYDSDKSTIKIMRPASGLVTALEPILRHCGGLWIAHGSGSADRETANALGEVSVPPSDPRYTLRRVWLNQDEEQGYYYGFSNEGLWPLCHLAHTRPIFRLSDWQQYCAVNRKFSQAIPSRALALDSLIIVQDYHFALMPRMIKERITTTGARIGIFWHIPWPNPEAFGICPWNQELLRGMLGADVIGFHTQYHCNNFLETCNRYLEARIDWEHFSVTMENRETLVRAFPIGIDTSPVRILTDTERVALKSKYGITASIVAVGVDRMDYTKGLVERMEAVERFLDKNPQYIGQFTLAQMASPSRGQIPTYRALVDQLQMVVDRVNSRFARGDYRPIVFLSQHHDWDEIQYFYQLGDLCLVTSLHDGMNLVAKEYVWCQRPERGALILSKFTGASRELTEALIVNPYSIEEMADAIATAVNFTPHEKSKRMVALREKVQEHNAYHWASDLIGALIDRKSATGRRFSATAPHLADPQDIELRPGA